jgi:hypothetical protein
MKRGKMAGKLRGGGLRMVGVEGQGKRLGDVAKARGEEQRHGRSAGRGLDSKI